MELGVTDQADTDENLVEDTDAAEVYIDDASHINNSHVDHCYSKLSEDIENKDQHKENMENKDWGTQNTVKKDWSTQNTENKDCDTDANGEMLLLSNIKSEPLWEFDTCSEISESKNIVGEEQGFVKQICKEENLWDDTSVCDQVELQTGGSGEDSIVQFTTGMECADMSDTNGAIDMKMVSANLQMIFDRESGRVVVSEKLDEGNQDKGSPDDNDTEEEAIDQKKCISTDSEISENVTSFGKQRIGGQKKRKKTGLKFIKVKKTKKSDPLSFDELHYGEDPAFHDTKQLFDILQVRLPEASTNPFQLMFLPDSNIQIVELHQIFNASVKTSIVIGKYFNVKVYVHRKEIPKTNAIWKLIPKRLKSFWTLHVLLENICKYRVCIGNPDHEFKDFVTNDRETPTTRKGKRKGMTAYRETGFGPVYGGFITTIRTTECLLLVAGGDRCELCKLHRSILWEAYYEQVKQD